jgi:hypothetical protein
MYPGKYCFAVWVQKHIQRTELLQFIGMMYEVCSNEIHSGIALGKGIEAVILLVNGSPQQNYAPP